RQVAAVASSAWAESLDHSLRRASLPADTPGNGAERESSPRDRRRATAGRGVVAGLPLDALGAGAPGILRGDALGDVRPAGVRAARHRGDVPDARARRHGRERGDLLPRLVPAEPLLRAQAVGGNRALRDAGRGDRAQRLVVHVRAGLDSLSAATSSRRSSPSPSPTGAESRREPAALPAGSW